MILFFTKMAINMQHFVLILQIYYIKGIVYA